MPDILLYGATGYTGKLILDAARARGIPLILAGRRAEALQAQAGGFETRVAALDDPAALASALTGIKAVLHAAGPFSATSLPMVDACLAAGVHYLDITGEIAVFEALAARSGEAKAAGSVLLPGVGFDVVPSDCLAAHVAGRLPGATRLRLAIDIGVDASRGTLKSMLEGMVQPLKVREDGRIVDRAMGSIRSRFDFGTGPRRCVAVSWGDVATAFHSTGIPSIETYFPSQPAIEVMTLAGRLLGPILAGPGPQGFLKSLVDRLPEGPDAARRARGRCTLLAEVEDASGRQVRSRLETPEGYTLTALTALEATRRVAAGEVPPGFTTPSGAFGADFILGFDGVARVDF
jgi:short subunit dehydrogenase-like uncharacterized protein